MYHRAQLKRDVKKTIAETKPRPMWVALVYIVITSAGASLLQSLFNMLSGASFLSEMFSGAAEKVMMGEDISHVLEDILLLYADRLISLIGTVVVSSIILSAILAVWQALMDVGFCSYCLALVRGEKPRIYSIFGGFPLAGKVVITSILVWVFITLWTLLFSVCLIVVVVIGALLTTVVPVVGEVLMVLGFIGFLIMVIRVTLRYSMTYYVLLDTGKFGLDAIAESKQMMKGNKGKLFMLYLSFIGWYLIAFAIVLVGCIVIVIAAGAAVAGISAGAANGSMFGGMIAVVFFVAIIMSAGIWLLDIWLLPYITGSVAKFYLFFKPQEVPVNDSWPTLGETTTYSEDSNSEY